MSEEPKQLDLLSLDIEEILRFMFGLTSTKAFQYLGVSLETGKEAEKDLVKAKLSIDCTSFLAEKLEPFTSDEENKQVKALISNLQLAYVKES